MDGMAWIMGLATDRLAAYGMLEMVKHRDDDVTDAFTTYSFAEISGSHQIHITHRILYSLDHCFSG